MSDRKPVEFAFGIGQQVSVAANGRNGIVKSQFVDEGGIQFGVNYADTAGKIHFTWAREGELGPPLAAAA